MIFLYVLLAMIILLLLICLCPVYLHLLVEEDIHITLNVLFFRFPLFPKPPPNPKKYSYRSLRRLAKRQIRKKKAKKSRKISNKKKGKHREKASPSEQIRNLLPVLIEIIRNLMKRFRKYLRIKVADLQISVATGDAAKTAIEYGYAAIACNMLTSLLYSIGTVGKKDVTNIRLWCDFLGEKTTGYADITFRLFVWQIIVTAIEAGLAFVFRGKIKKGKAKCPCEQSAEKQNDGEQEKKEANARAAMAKELFS